MAQVNASADVSVVVPTYNRAPVLEHVLPTYLRSPLVREVLVVDDGSTDETATKVERLSKHDPRIRLLRNRSNLGRIAARSKGIAAAKGDLVLLSEDDLALTPGALTTLAAHMQTSGADIIAGRRIWMRFGESEAHALARANRCRLPVVSTRLMEHFSHATALDDVEAPLVNATMLVRREVLEQVRFPDIYPGNAWREESDFQLTARKMGFKIVFCPHAVFYHYDRAMAGRGQDRLRSDLTYLYWIFRNNLTFLRRHRSYLRREIPQALILGSPLLTNLVYILYRSALLTQTELRRAWRSHRYRAEEAPTR